MVGVLRLDKMDYSCKPGDIRRLFKDHGARPEDIHLVLDNSGRHTGSAFLVFKDKELARKGLIVDGVLFLNRRITVRESNPPEFNKTFPGIPMFSAEPSHRGSGRVFNDKRRPEFHNEFHSDKNRSRMFEPSTFGRGFSRNNPNNTSFDNNNHERNSFASNHRTRNDRSRSPMNRRDSDTRKSFLRNFSEPSRRAGPPPRMNEHHRGRKRDREDIGNNFGAGADPFNNNPLDNVNDRKFVKLNKLPFNVKDIEIQNFFQPILSRDIFYMRNTSGKYAGKPNGSVIVEFYSENDARQALKLDGKRFGSKSAYIHRPMQEEIIDAIQGKFAEHPSENTTNQLSQGINGLAAVAGNNPQVQHLLDLLQATVSTIAGATSSSHHNMPMNDNRPGGQRSFDRPDRRRDRQPDDPVITRVATSANIDVSDISMGRVVGIRNLPYSVTPGEILQFFNGFHAVPDSVRIHYLEDGRCSGDAIISFRGNKDARSAVSSLNKRTIARRKVELFFL